MINKKIIMFVGMVLLVAGVTYVSGVVFFGGNAYEDSEDKLVLDMDLTEANYDSGTKTFTDNSGEANDGVSVNAASFTTDEYGVSTGAMSFNGVDDWVNISSGLSSISGNVTTLSAWIKLKKYDTSGCVLLGTNTRSNAFWQIYSDTTVYLSANKITITSTDFDDDTWRHVVFVSDGINSVFYVNGVQKGSDTGAVASFSTGAKNFVLGEWIGGLGASWTFNGSISQVKVWNRSLSATEVMALYNSSKPKAFAGSSQSGLVGHWELDSDDYNFNTERITDKTPYENHGTNYGATLTTDRMGHVDKAMNFSGSSNYINLGDIFEFATENFSISGWIKFNSHKDYNGILGRGYLAGATGYGLYGNSGGNLFFQIRVGGSITHITSNSALDEGKWYHFVAVRNYTGTSLLYIDNIQQTDTETETKDLSGSYNFRIGSNSGGIHVLNGSLSDIRIYNRVLSADEINALYSSYRPKAASGSLKKGLVLDMPLTLKYTKDETVGSEIMTDRTPYSNDGQNYGASVGSGYSSFDGNDYVDCGSGIDFTNAIFSASIWVYHTTTTADTYIGKWQTGANPGNNSWLLYGNGGTMLFYIEESDNSSIGSVASGVYTINNWYHVVGVANGSTLKLYVDGVLKDSDPYDGTINPGVENIVIGIFDGNYPLHGRLASVKIYNRALSETEIKLLYDKGR